MFGLYQFKARDSDALPSNDISVGLVQFHASVDLMPDNMFEASPHGNE